MSTLQMWHPEALDVPASPQKLVEESEALQEFISKGENVGILQNIQLPEMVLSATLDQKEKELINGLSDAALTPYSMQLKSHRSWLKKIVTEQGHEVFSVLRARGSRVGELIVKNLIVVEDTFLFGHSHRAVNQNEIDIQPLNQIDVDEFCLLSSAAHRRSA